MLTYYIIVNIIYRKDRDMRQIYLAGNMTPSSEYYHSWTRDFAELLDFTKFRTTVAKDSIKTDKFIVRHDVARLLKSDILVANLSVSNKEAVFTGLVAEMVYAYENNIPVYTFTDEDMMTPRQAQSPWIKYFVTAHFDSWESMVEFLNNSEHL